MSLFSQKPPNISSMKKQKNIDGLIKALEYKEVPQVRAEVVKSLGTMKQDMP